MGLDTRIEWCDASWSPWLGCEKVSAGCKYCYAEHDTPARVARAKGQELWGKTGVRREASDNYWKMPEVWQRWARTGTCLVCKGKNHDCPACDGKGFVEPYRLRVFPSQCDPFEDRPELDAVRRRLFKLIQKTPNLDWLLLTKRPENIHRLTYKAIDPADDPDCEFNIAGEPNGLDVAEFGELYPNVWLGTSVENQEMADRRIAYLENVPAAVRFLSCEPLLGDVDLKLSVSFAGGSREITDRGRAIHWVITGGESGHGARECHLDWIDSIVSQCGAADLPVFVKQLGAKPMFTDSATGKPVVMQIRDKKGGDVRDFPCHFHRQQPLSYGKTASLSDRPA